jgi:hypothetical protein
LIRPKYASEIQSQSCPSATNSRTLLTIIRVPLKVGLP